jgi:hypothetical protein
LSSGVSAINTVYTEFTVVNGGALSKLGHAHSKALCVCLLFSSSTPTTAECTPHTSSASSTPAVEFVAADIGTFGDSSVLIYTVTYMEPPSRQGVVILYKTSSRKGVVHTDSYTKLWRQTLIRWRAPTTSTPAKLFKVIIIYKRMALLS